MIPITIVIALVLGAFWYKLRKHSTKTAVGPFEKEEAK